MKLFQLLPLIAFKSCLIKHILKILHIIHMRPVQREGSGNRERKAMVTPIQIVKGG